MILAIYTLCALTALCCSILLLQAAGRTKSRMLFWSGFCFALLTVTNVLVIVDYYVLIDRALWPLRHGIVLVALSALIYGLIFEER
jgi:tellurite resistance protein TehA-like permease